MASRLFSLLARGLANPKINIPFKLYGIPEYSRQNLRHRRFSYFSLTAAAALALLSSRRDDGYFEHIAIRLPSFPFGSLVNIENQGVLYNSLSAVHRAPPVSEDQFTNSASSCTKTDSPCLTKNSIADAAAKVSPSVVNLTVSQGVRGMFLGKAAGSGTIIDPDGIILTNAHVVAEFTGSSIAHNGRVTATLQDGRTFEGKVLSADFHTDIAVVKINSKTPLPTAKLGSSSKLRPGDWVIALGSPLFLQNTVTAGIISCVDRKSSDLGLGGAHREYLQTDCAINQGNSGGPLVNLDGEVIGINNMKVIAADGVSFAIPIDSVIRTLEQLKKHGRVVRPWLGLKMLDLNELVITQLKERDPTFPDVVQGVLVCQVTPGSPADRAGFRSGDVVIMFDGKPIKSMKEIVEALGDKIGAEFKATIKRAQNKNVVLSIISEESTQNM